MFLKVSVGSGSVQVRVEVFGSGSGPGIAMPVRFGFGCKNLYPCTTLLQINQISPSISHICLLITKVIIIVLFTIYCPKFSLYWHIGCEQRSSQILYYLFTLVKYVIQRWVSQVIFLKLSNLFYLTTTFFLYKSVSFDISIGF